MFTAFITLTTHTAAMAETQPIRVLVYGEHKGENIVYHYTVINNGTESFNNVTIGSRYHPKVNGPVPQLGKLPVGWKYGRTGEVGTEIILDPNSARQPQGWALKVYGQGLYSLKWLIPAENDATTSFIKPGQTLSGFSVTVPKIDPPYMQALDISTEEGKTYVNGTFEVGYWSESKQKFEDIYGPIEKQDATPPTLSVSVTPATLWPPNGKSVPVTVTLSVKDDYDPAPEIKLESITANEPLEKSWFEKDDIVDAKLGTDYRQFSLKAKRDGANKAGRIYTMTYSATDAIGNKATASATVTVPHDEGKK